jgi:SnoaL-like domain
MTSGHPRSADVATLIDRYDAALNAHDLDAIASMHDDAIVFHNHTARERVAGATAGRAHIGAIFARWPAATTSRRGVDRACRAPRRRSPTGMDGVDIFPLTPDGRSRKNVSSSCATPRVL